jgi:hypothetical protein
MAGTCSLPLRLGHSGGASWRSPIATCSASGGDEVALALQDCGGNLGAIIRLRLPNFGINEETGSVVPGIKQATDA